MKKNEVKTAPSPNVLKKIAMVGTIAAFMFMAIASTDEEETSKPPDSSTRTAVGRSKPCGNVEVVITSASTRNEVGDDMLKAKASKGGIYVVVEWSYKNITKKPISMFDGPSMSLVSDDGTKYDSDADATSSHATEGDNDEKVVSDLNPGITVSGSEVFEVSKELFEPTKWSALVESDGSTCWFNLQ
jgi:Domain of unknown function (DUF4352)